MNLAAFAGARSQIHGATSPLNTVRVGFADIGVKGSQHVRNLLHMEGVDLRAVWDILEEPCKQARAWAAALGKPEPTAYTRGDRDFERMCDREDLDLVYTATPWRWHAPIVLTAMRAGKHAATEILIITCLESYR